MGKQLTPAVYVLTLLHHPHRVFGTVNTADPSPDAYTVQSSLGKLITWLPEHFRFLGIALYGFLHCELL
ncbi:hypothetical protein IQ269_01630 [Tychonema sp. LEGE 07199]|uniref:hypothetical protein n=1 Tax=unclassified Tychonema TaxID=2642144 RepID=UPI001881FA40|nr:MULTISPECIES: hypothetical protein [unclassified Tychonema]MBE9119533.1 hypothetical protein [Tychonema sp. LEGE 07199]MBE9130695.1 hypothetical protein [Tychonema sp. LEGE 07196]